MRSRRALLTAAGVVSLVLLQLYTAHRYTTSARAVATGVGGRLNGLWARYKERNFTMPRFLSGPHVVSKGMFNVSASQWLFSARPKSGGSVPHLTLPAVNRTAERERNERDRTEMLQALERQVKDGIKLSARAAPLFQKSSRVSPAPARQGARAGGGAPSNASSTMGDPVAGARNSSLAASGAIGEAVPDVSNRTRGAVGPSVGRRGAGRRGKGEGGSKGKPGKVLLFTMDSLLKTIEEAKHGGPAGEITVRTSLEAGLLELGFSLDVAGSDDHFAQLSAAALSALRRSGTHYYRFIIMDPWTWAEKAPPSAHTAVRARPLLEGRENATFILDFFGNKKLAIRDAELKIPKAHVLTAFPRSGSLPWHLDPACHLHPASQCVGPRRPPPVASRPAACCINARRLLHQVACAVASSCLRARIASCQLKCNVWRGGTCGRVLYAYTAEVMTRGRSVGAGHRVSRR